jgi:hypothetical protein
MIMYFFSSFPEDKTNMQKDFRPELANIQWSEKVATAQCISFHHWYADS